MRSISRTNRVHHRCLLALCLTVVFNHAFLPLSDAQITLDGSLGPGGPLTGPHYEISAGIGQLRGRNLFHSFGQFNVRTGERATFTGPATVDHILTRVTGGSPSVIDGLLQSNIPGASLFLLNPSGVMFGPNAQLDLRGSFHVSTADVLRFGDGATFAANLADTSTLTVAPPAAFGFLHDHPAGITIRGSQLAAHPGATLSVTGGDLTLTASQEPLVQPPSVVAPSGRVALTSVASAGEVPVERGANAPGVSAHPPGRLGSVRITDGALVDASGERGGTIRVDAGTLTLADQATLRSSTFGAGQGGDVVIQAGDFVLSGGSAIISSAEPGSSGTAGHVRVDARTAAIHDGAFLSSFTLGDGRGGDVTVRADTLTLEGFSSQLVAATLGGRGDAGHVRVDARTVTVTNGAQIASVTTGAGRGGDLTIIARDAVIVDGFGVGTLEGQEGVLPSVIATSSQAGSTGDAGSVRVEAGRVTVSKGAQIQSGTAGQGRGGDLTVIARDAVIVDGFGGGGLSLITASSLLGPTGDAGNVRVEAQTVTATNGAQISSATFGTGQGGSVTVMAHDSVTFRGTSPPGEVPLGVLFPGESTFASGAFAASVGSGAPGRVQVTAPRVILAEGGGISSLNVASQGVGGTVIVQASDTLAISGVGSSLSTASLGPGAGGDIIINAGTLSLTDGAEISAASLRTDDATASGNAGHVTVTVGKSLLIQDSGVTTEATQADGGDITLRVQDMIQLRNSEVTATVGGGPSTVGGNITIDPQFVILEGSRIIANAFEGTGGNIRIEAGVFLADPNSRVDASSALGIQGTVDIQAPVTNLSGALAPLPQVPVTVAELLPARCAARLSGGIYSSLVLGGREGLPFDPGGLLPSPLTLDTEVQADPTGTGGSRPQNPTSRIALLTIHDKLFPRMRVSNANGSLQTPPELWCSKSLGERQAGRKKSR